jgi:hypothetical protein
MIFKRRFLQWVTAGLLLVFPASLFAAAVRVGGSAQRGAIDTLTVGDNGFLRSVVAASIDTVIFETDSLASATATRDRIVQAGEFQLNCKFFRIQKLGADRFQINGTDGRIITSIQLNGIEIPSGFPDSSKAGQTFQRDDSGQNPPLMRCRKVPSVSFYGLIALALLLAGTAVWMFRKRRVGVA